MNIDLKEYPDVDKLLGLMYTLKLHEKVNVVKSERIEWSYNFLFNITESELERLSEFLDNPVFPPDFVGLWMSNSLIRTKSLIDGSPRSNMTSITKVVMEEKLVPMRVYEYLPVNNTNNED